MGALGAQKRGLGALLLKAEKMDQIMARCTFFEGRYFLGHPNTPRLISKDAGTVPAHFDLGFIVQLSKLTFRPTVNVQLGYVAKISKIVLHYTTRALYIIIYYINNDH